MKNLFSAGLIGLGALMPTTLYCGGTESGEQASLLAEWTVTGPKPTFLGGGPAFQLGAGSQVARTFAAGSIGVSLRTTPHFSATPDDAALLELGGTALVFLREGDAGRIAMVAMETMREVASIAVPLNSAGASDSLDLVIIASPTETTVAIGGEVAGRASIPHGATELEIVLSAGKAFAWPIDSLEVVALVPP
ncbi:MAG TPA: hypothetical protein VEB66_05240 [Opitutaceae bacterium]|nr:hypothetical protein [Opitutaceae bacterium]